MLSKTSIRVQGIIFPQFANYLKSIHYYLMNLKFANATQKPRRYFGLHFVKGLAEYRDANFNGGEPYKILVGEAVMKKMDASFEGCPVYVHHVDEVKLEDIQEADGYVVRSFYNKADGNHWVEFMIVSDRGHDAIAKGWSLSNAYFMQEPVGQGGEWHAIEYKQELLNGEFEHLAIVPNPRYQESGEVGILTPEKYKAYCEKKDSELTKLQNSKNNEKVGEKPMFKLFKKNTVEDKETKDLQNMTVELPKSKKEVTLTKLVNDADEKEMHKNDKMYADDKHMVKINDDEEMSVEELKNKYNDMMKSKNDDADKELEGLEADKKNDDEAKDKEEKKDDAKKNAKDTLAEKQARIEALKNAKETAKAQDEVVFMSSKEKVELGKQLF